MHRLRPQLAIAVLTMTILASHGSTTARADDVEVTAGAKGFSLKSADGAHELRLRALLHSDGRFGVDDEKRQVADTFVLRRARLVLEGKTHGYFSFRLMPDWGEGRPQLVDFYADIRPRAEIGVRVGKFKSPVGLERLQSAFDLTFIERAYPTSVAPNRDVGVNLLGSLARGAIEYQGGVVNGSVDGGSNDLDVSDAKDLVGRVFVRWSSLGLGVAFTSGDQSGAPPSYRSPGQATIASYAQNVVLDDTRTRIAPQAHLYVGPVGLLGEYVASKQTLKRDATRVEVETKAFQVAGSIALTGETASYRSITPLRPLDATGSGTGAVELAARYATLELDGAAFEAELADPARSVEKATTVTAGVNWHLQKSLKWQIDFETTTFEGGAPDGGDRPDEKVVLTRFQFAI